MKISRKTNLLLSTACEFSRPIPLAVARTFGSSPRLTAHRLRFCFPTSIDAREAPLGGRHQPYPHRRCPIPDYTVRIALDIRYTQDAAIRAESEAEARGACVQTFID